MSKTLPISEVKARLPELVTGIVEREEEVVVTADGSTTITLFPCEELMVANAY